MGQAKLKRAATGAAIPPVETQTRIREAVMKTLEAMDFPRVCDCLYHAAATVGALQAAGIEAELEAGAAYWAVGPDPADTLSHGYDPTGRMIADEAPFRPGLMHMHAWAAYSVFGVRYAVDMTTYQIPEKARLMAQADGMPLNVTMP